MIINGTITGADTPSEPSGQYQVRYQDVCITDNVGKEWFGRIGSKQGYQANTPISVTVEEKPDGSGGASLYFRKYNPQYPQRNQSAPQQARQAVAPMGLGADPQHSSLATSRPPQSTNSKKEVDWDAKECRGHRAMCMAYAKDLVVAGKIDVNDMDSWVKDRVTFIWDGLTGRGGQSLEKRHQGGSPVPQNERDELDEYLD